MMDIVHTADPTPTPARPILASQLLELEEKQRTRFTRHGKPERLSTACEEIDELLGGEGVERGIVVGISAESGEGRLISLNILASILLSHLPTTTTPSLRATIIDTTGSFPLALLAKVLKSCITASRISPNSIAGIVTPDIDTEVQKCLEMIGISRVFDLEGLWEVLGEIGRVPPDDNDLDRATSPQPTKEVEIPNSDDEEDLTSSPPQSQKPHQVQEDNGIEIIIIDSLTHIINELFSRKEKSDAHTLLSLLSKSLTTLSQTTNILTLLHNTTIPIPSTSTPKQAPQSSLHYQPPPLHPQIPRAQTQSATLFPSNTTKPALGQVFSQFPSLHLSLSQLPKRRREAEVLYGGDDGKGVEVCTVIEVLKDEAPNLGVGREERWFGTREGRWCAVDVRKDRVGFEGAFEVKRDMRGVALGKEKVHGGGRVGFGGEVGTVSSVTKV